MYVSNIKYYIYIYIYEIYKNIYKNAILACSYKSLISFIVTRVSRSFAELFTKAVMHQGSYRASLLHQKSHTCGAGYMMQMSKCIRLQIMLW